MLTDDGRRTTHEARRRTPTHCNKPLNQPLRLCYFRPLMVPVRRVSATQQQKMGQLFAVTITIGMGMCVQSVLGDISETTVLPPVPHHVTGMAVVKIVIVQIRYATIFTDAITETNVPQDLLETIVLIHVHFHVMEHSVMTHVTVPVHPVIMSMDAISPHSLQQVLILVRNNITNW
uniref:Uncharacterized protein LOC111106185 isoform X2 n=1 Tax=Crassostrea virginica TaxID=6565 RepID=A0A8B8AZ66_CRAVI|nr:uncharacterized protein LOC111106185 isoform X2 [Crassostrea virginica]